MDAGPRKLTDFKWVAQVHIQKVLEERETVSASAATINPKFRWDNRSPNLIVALLDNVPPSAGGRLNSLVTLSPGIHAYGATLKIQPEGLASWTLLQLRAPPPEQPAGP